MKTTLLPSLATLASWRFKFLSSTPHAAGDKWAGHGGPALPFLRETPPRSPRLRVSHPPKPPLRPFATFASLRFTLLFLLSTLSAHATRDLLVANPATHSILRFDGQTGASKSNFIANSSLT